MEFVPPPLPDPDELDLGNGVFLDDDHSTLSDPQFAPPTTPEEDMLLEDTNLASDEFSWTWWDPGSRLPDGLEVAAELNADLIELSLRSRTAEHLVRRVIEEAEQAEQLVRKVWEEAWKVCHFSSLPKWLQDNDFLIRSHRPPLPSFSACFFSIFRIHTETGNIWTHLLGCLFFIAAAVYFLAQPCSEIQWEEKIVFSAFFAGAIVCLGMSFTFHTVHCHSEKVGRLFSKLDYCGIALLIIGSFVPWLYYGFYCNSRMKVIYLSLVILLGLSAIIVSLWDKFGEPRFRTLRAGVFTVFGLSGVVPALHYLVAQGWAKALSQASFGWLCLMGSLYILGAAFYTLRIPERLFPGKCDIWPQSHQIFHVLVIAAALVHYHAITEMAVYRLSTGDCAEDRWLLAP